jgi:hypothetical protein
MTLNTQTDWHQIATMEEDEQRRWMDEHGMYDEDVESRRQWQREFIAGCLGLEEDERTRLAHGLLASLVTKEDPEARAFASDFQWVMDHGKGDDAFAMVSALFTGARGMPVEDTMRLAQVWPRIFGKDVAAV